jgi:DNA mismatch repair protein MutS2
MTGERDPLSPDGVLASADVGTPFVLEGKGSGAAALAVLDFPLVLAEVAGLAAGALGAESILRRLPSADVGWIAAELATVAELARLARENRGLVAEAVPDLTAPLGRLRVSGSVLEGSELLAILRTLRATRLVVGELKRVAPDAPRAALFECPAPDRSLERRLEIALDDDGDLRDSASPALAAARADVRAARDQLVRRLEQMLHGVAGDGTVTLRNGRYVIPVARELRGRPDGIVHGESASGATLFIEPSAAIPLGNALREAEAREDREVLRVYRDLTELVRPERETIAGSHAMCVRVDDAAARARYAAARDGELPAVAAAPAPLRIVNGRHPLLLRARTAGPMGTGAAAEPASPVVPFDLELEAGARTLLISGPNTGGKSVLLKAVGLACVLAQSGIIPPVGKGTTLPVFGRLFADIGDRQSIAESLSTFSAHVAILRDILDQADDATLVLLDEIGSGTDPAEGAALAAATLLSLTRRGTLTLATTHLGALKQLATEVPGIVNGSLQFDAATLTPSYRFEKGVPGRSYGLAIAKRLGLPADVLSEAEAQVPVAERNLDALLASVEERGRANLRKESQLSAGLAETEALRTRLEHEASLLEARESALKRRERDAEKAARAQARSHLLEARALVEQAIQRAQAPAEGAAKDARRLLEEAAAIETDALRRLEADSRPSPQQSPALAPGQRVRLDSGSTGEVLELRSDREVVVRIGSMRVVTEVATLTPLPGRGEPSTRRAAEPSTRRAAEPSTEGAGAPPLEIDLRGLTGDEAEQSVLSAIDAAVLAEHPYLRIIHGKGTGVVRERVQKVVARDRRVRSHAFAPANQGGTGVTVLEFEG